MSLEKTVMEKHLFISLEDTQKFLDNLGSEEKETFTIEDAPEWVTEPSKSTIVDEPDGEPRETIPEPSEQPTISENPIKDAAIGYVKEGFSVVRITPGQKRVYGYWSEYQMRLPTEGELNQWFSKPYYQLGVVCGSVSNNFFGIDFDGEYWEKWLQIFLEKFPEILNTRRVRTGSGKPHFWGRCPGLSNVIKRLGGRGKVERVFQRPDGLRGHEAIELRMDRCIVMAPPSTHPNGTPYVFVDPDIPIKEFSEEGLWKMVEFLREGQPEGQAVQRRPGETPELTDEKQERLASFYVRCALRQVESGASRNEKGFQLGCNLRDLGLDVEQARPFMEQYREQVPERDHPYSSEEAINSLESAYESARKEPWIPEGFFGPGDGALPEEQIQRLLNYPLTDAGNAESFIEIHGERFIFVPEKKKWLMWDGVRWLEEEHEARASMVETARTRRKLSGSITEEYSQKAFRKWNVGSENMGRVKSALESAEIWRRKNIRLFDTEPYILCCENGVVNLRAGQFRRSNHSDWLSKSTGVHYDPESQCPRWLQFLDEIFQGDGEITRFIRKSAGYCLTGDITEHCLWVCFGTGANGKSTFLEVLSSILGEYAQTMPSSTLKEKRGDDIPTDIARLCGTRFAKMIEMKEHATLNAERVKSLTGGDKVVARFLHQDFFEFDPQFKLWLAVNHKPIVRDTSESIWRRIRLVNFDAHFPPESQDKYLRDILREERSGILNWAIEGCLEWQEEGLTPPPKVLNATQEYRNESDALSRFIDEMCLNERRIEIEDLYNVFVEWWKENETDEPWKMRTFKSKLREKGYKAAKGGRSGGGYWEGICLK
jgi:P4 family phage/plasmid primase-like protien